MATLLEQSIEYQKQELARLRAEQIEFDRVGSNLFRQTRDARNALNAARADPATPPATLNQLQQTYDRIQEERATNNYNRNANEFKISQIETALQNNETKLANPANNTSVATVENTTSNPGNDPQIDQQATAQLNQQSGTVPANQSATSNEPPVPTQDPAVTEDPDDFFIDEDGNLQRFGGNQKQTVDNDPSITEEPDDEIVEYDEPPEIDDEPTFEGDEGGEQVEYFGPPAVEGDEGEQGFLEGDEGGQEFINEPGIPTPEGSARGLPGAETNTRAQATAQDSYNYNLLDDWRVKLKLAPTANYLYKAPDVQGILAPLAATDGVLFPYTPNIQVQYAATYDPTEITHSNYKIFQYRGSSVDSISITCDFTAQDTYEANYVLAVIHFFRSITKMFYGQDQDPKPGTPPPLCYIEGMGAFQFNNHPIAITGFTYNLPTDVDYIRASVTSASTLAGQSRANQNVPVGNSTTNTRLTGGLTPGGNPAPPIFQLLPPGSTNPSYVPTKMQVNISAIPIVSRNDISNRFSLKDYATGKIYGGTSTSKGGIW